MIRYTNDVPPRVDRYATFQYTIQNDGCSSEDLCIEIDRLQRELAKARDKPCPYVTGGETKHCSLAEQDARDAAYYKHRLKTILPLFEEARDALPAITETSRKLRGIAADLADRMDEAGTYSREKWDAAMKESS